MITKRRTLIATMIAVMLGLAAIYAYTLLRPRPIDAVAGVLGQEVNEAINRKRSEHTANIANASAANKLRFRLQLVRKALLDTVMLSPPSGTYVKTTTADDFIDAISSPLERAVREFDMVQRRQGSNAATGPLAEIEIQLAQWAEQLSFDLVERRNRLYRKSSMRSLAALQSMSDTIEVKELLREFSSSEMKRLQTQAIAQLDRVISDIDNIISESATANTTLNTQIDLLTKEVQEVSKTGNNRIMMTLVLPIFSVIVVLLLAVPYLYRTATAQEDGIVFSSLFEHGLLLKLFTVFILTIAIMILGIGGQLESQTLGTLLGAISVHVLQSSFSKDQERPQVVPAQQPGVS
ncbi:MAG TPA: hypothetical protein VGE21_06565 [Flavobacteriales bacterium]